MQVQVGVDEPVGPWTSVARRAAAAAVVVMTPPKTVRLTLLVNLLEAMAPVLWRGGCRFIGVGLRSLSQDSLIAHSKLACSLYLLFNCIWKCRLDCVHSSK